MNASEYLEVGLKIKIDETMAAMINNEVSFKKFPRKHIILLEGTKSTSIYFIIRGIVRGYYIDEQGNDITKCFASEHEFFSSEGLRSDSVSSFNIECIEDCECIQLSYGLVYKMINETKNFHSIFIKLCLQAIEKLEGRVKNLVLMNADERYMDFCKQYSYIHDRIELKYIASYIGIKAASLSRIRKRMKSSYCNLPM